MTDPAVREWVLAIAPLALLLLVILAAAYLDRRAR